MLVAGSLPQLRLLVHAQAQSRPPALPLLDVVDVLRRRPRRTGRISCRGLGRWTDPVVDLRHLRNVRLVGLITNPAHPNARGIRPERRVPFVAVRAERVVLLGHHRAGAVEAGKRDAVRESSCPDILAGFRVRLGVGIIRAKA